MLHSRFAIGLAVYRFRKRDMAMKLIMRVRALPAAMGRGEIVQGLLLLSMSSIIMLNLATNRVAAAENRNGELLNGAKAFSSDQQITLATERIEAEPKNPRGYFVRARLYAERGEPTKALSDYDQALKLDPSMAEAWQRRGIIHFQLAHIEESISDFDRFLKLVPTQAPYHWQRGICYYYAKRFEEGRKQFELHQTVNPNDVENAVWHFLCVARSAGVEKARASLIPIQEDARVPMMQIHGLFAGKTKADDVLKAARAGEPVGQELQRRLFYAHLYIGLYSEAIGDETQAREHITKAAHEYGGADYMSDVAHVHLILRGSNKNNRANR
jgi:lipoprotein NlpI